MSDPNKHIEEYLAGYLQQPEVSYAVMISGKWGSGKTYFLKKYIKEWEDENRIVSHKDSKKFCYLSMNGVTKTEELDRKLFFSLHPKLNKKHFHLLSQFAYGAIGFLKSGESIQKVLKELKLSDFTNDAANRILIFDDLERCHLQLKTSLGYINDFVEHSKCHVIVACDESKIFDQDENRALKEKLFGKTIEVRNDLSAILNSFIDSLRIDVTKNLLNSRKDLIKKIFLLSETNNLRLLKNGLMDFEEIFIRIQRIAEETKNINNDMHDKLFESLFCQHLCFYFEIGAGRLAPKDATGKVNIEWNSYIANKMSNISSSVEQQLKTAEVFLERYQSVFKSILSGPMIDLWPDWFEGAYFSEIELQKRLSKSEFAENKPVFLKLTRPYDLNDEEFLTAIFESWKEFEDSKIQDALDLLLFSELMQGFAEKGLVEETTEVVKDRILKQIKSFKIDFDLLPQLYDNPISIRGFGIEIGKNGKTRTILDALLNQIYEHITQEGKDHQDEILRWVENEPHMFVNHFMPITSGSDIRYKTPKAQYALGPSLAAIETKRFFNSLLKTPNTNKDDIFYTLKKRAHQNYVFFRELDFIRGVKKELETYLKETVQKKPSYYILQQNGLRELNEAILYLETEIKRTG